MANASAFASLNGAGVLITGGAGFVGSRVAMALAAEGARVTSLDNLHRRGSELNLDALAAAGVTFVKGDVRVPGDLALHGAPIDLIVDCAAEPSVMAGRDGSPRYAIDSNLGGTINCVELARERRARLVFLSTSRVYPMSTVNALKFKETATRFALCAEQDVAGASGAGIAETFPLAGARTLYGTTKLASELLIEEYAATYGLEASVLRFGVIAGPGQMGKTDQGVFCHWMARHMFGGELAYHGWGGSGKQVRDVVHIDDATELVRTVLRMWPAMMGRTYNAGGGAVNSLSLLETTALCRDLTGKSLALGARPATDPSDVRSYISDHSALTAATGWQPTKNPSRVLADIFEWMRADEQRLRAVFAS